MTTPLTLSPQLEEELVSQSKDRGSLLMRGKHTSKTLHVATRTSAPGGGALVLPSDGAGSDERQDVATHTPAQEDVAWHPSALPQLTSAAVPAGQVPSLPPCPRPYSPLPQALLPTLGPAASLLELARGLRLCMAPAHVDGCGHFDGCAHVDGARSHPWLCSHRWLCSHQLHS